MYTFEEVAIKIEPIRSMHLLKEKQCYKMLNANSTFLFFIHIVILHT